MLFLNSFLKSNNQKFIVIMNKSKSKQQESLSPKGKAVDLSMALMINGNSLESQPSKNSVPVEQKFKSEKEFNELIVNNSKMLFGKSTILIDATKSLFECYLLLDFSEAEKHKLYFVDITLSKQNFWELFTRITRLFALFNFRDYQNKLVELVLDIIGENTTLKSELNPITGENIDEYFKVVLINKPFILLLTDQERPELIEINMAYSTYWGKFVKPILIRKYADNGDLFCSITPAFADIDFTTNGKSGKDSIIKREKSTEADHLENTSEIIQGVYMKIKTDLLKEDKSIEFNPKQYYISMRKNRNLAFFHISKKRISLVVMNPEKDTQEEIKHHEVKTLTEKVQKFWNGPSCTIIIDNMDNIDEIIALLKKLIQQ
jgi:predicted transport protein